jgi:thiamine-phosphate pyrophosphorylase
MTNLPYRTIDANLNRLREGVRVVEDLLRYQFNSPLAHQFKEVRHLVKVPDLPKIVAARSVEEDILRETRPEELERGGIEEVIIANLKRAEESARVLEEVYKLHSPGLSERFKQIRYTLYRLEKGVMELLYPPSQKGENEG